MPRANLKQAPLFFATILAVVAVATVYGNIQDESAVKPLTSMEAFQETLFRDFDFLNVYLFCSQEVENCRLIEPIYAEFGNTMKDFVRIYSVTCEQTATSATGESVFPACNGENRQHLPYLLAFEPPTTKFNPYTKQPAKPIEHVYQGNADVKSLANFARQHMPVFRESISTKAQLDKFVTDEYVPNKVILFTNKPQTSPLYKALASEFHNKLLFAEIHENSKDLIQELQVDKFPTILVLKKNAEGGYEPQIYSQDLAIDKLRTFLNEFALEERAERPDLSASSSGSQGQQQGERAPPSAAEIKVNTVTAKNFEEEVNKHERLVLVHLTTDERVPVFDQVLEKFTRFFEYFELDCSQPENEEFAKNVLNVKSLPAIVVLPLGKEKKLSNRRQFSKGKTIQEITEEISELIGDKVLPVSQTEMQGVITNSLSRGIPAFFFLFDTPEVSLTYRMLSQLSKYENKLTFTKFKDPGPEVLKHFEISKLPALIVVLIADQSGANNDEIDPNKVQLAKYSGRYNYEDLSRYFDLFIHEGEVPSQVTDKQLTEIQTQEDLHKHCPPESRACLIALLNGNKDDPQVNTRLQENLNSLNQVLKRNPHLPFLWIDAICHSEVLLALNVQSEAVPTVVVYSPTLKEFTQLVGTFDTASISVFLEKALKRRLATYPLSSGLSVEQRQCSEVHESIKRQEQASGDDLDDDIMREILAEARKKEEETRTSKKKKKKKYNDDL